MGCVELVSVLQNRYPTLKTQKAADFNGDGKFDANERLKDFNGDGKVDDGDYWELALNNAKYIEKEIRGNVISCISEKTEGLAKISVIAQLEKAKPLLLEMVKDNDYQTRLYGALLLTKIGDVPAALPVIREFFQTYPWSNPIEILFDIHMVQSGDNRITQTLKELFRAERDESKRIRLATTLFFRGDKDKDVIAVYAEKLAEEFKNIPNTPPHPSLESRRRDIKDSKIKALKELGTATAISALKGILAKETDARIRLELCSALIDLGCKDEDVVGALVVSLGEPEVNIKLAAAEHLIKLGKSVESTIPVLVKVLEEKEIEQKPARRSESFGEERLSDDAKRIRDLLAEKTRTEDREKAAGPRRHAAFLLVEAESKAAVPALIRALDDSDQEVRILAAIALGSIGSGNSTVLSALKKRLEFVLGKYECSGKPLCVVKRGSYVEQIALEAAIKRLGGTR